ncbi:MAG: N-6 DNA methylase, partial [Candidatus Helarchaeota archaeon]|nr:N-6 DNA methylase [Candidatus Helarchaeota archaeon]
LMKFAPQKAKEGEIYTPREVIKLMVEILEPKPGKSVYDPCCGSGGMLIISHSHVAEKYGEEEVRKLFLYGQERSPTIYATCQMNLLLHDIKNGEIVNGDTLDYPRLRENGRLKTFDIVIANPPWNQDGYGEDRLKKANFRERFTFGYSPNDKADWAWVQHMLASSKEKVGIVLDQGALFRGGSEREIRKQIVEKDWIECVVLLPPKLFYNTGASGIIIIFNKNKPRNRKGKVLFLNAIEEFEKHPEVRRLYTLSSNNIKKITKAYENFRNVAGFAKVADLKELGEKDYNLNITLYAPLIEKEEKINIKEVYRELEKLREGRGKTEKKVREYLEGILKAG